MSLLNLLDTLSACARNLWRNPRESLQNLAGHPEAKRGCEVARGWTITSNCEWPEAGTSLTGNDILDQPLRAYFDEVKEGFGVWKWLHYFELYDRHLRKFVGRPVTVAEVGVYSGGSLPMWRSYFGTGCRMHGVDIQEECKTYTNSYTTIHVGDQADREFWKRFRGAVPHVDVFIDDGGHEPEQQMVTLEEMLHHLSPGGVYICEDVHGTGNRFGTFVHSLADELNALNLVPQQKLASVCTPFQAAINSVHLYPFVVVIEKRDAVLQTLSAPKHGTEWQPFFDRSGISAGHKRSG